VEIAWQELQMIFLSGTHFEWIKKERKKERDYLAYALDN
jgi:hypothetical protein